MDVKANWKQSQQVYVADHYEKWVSEDGDNWLDPDGQPASGDSFDLASIKLVGGPRDGEWVG